MPAKRELTMRQIRQILRLVRDGFSAREIGRMLGVARSTVQDNLRRAEAAGLAWPLPADLTDDVLEDRLFARAGVKRGFRRRAEPEWSALACELKRPGVNLMVLCATRRPSGLLDRRRARRLWRPQVGTTKRFAQAEQRSDPRIKRCADLADSCAAIWTGFSPPLTQCWAGLMRR